MNLTNRTGLRPLAACVLLNLSAAGALAGPPAEETEQEWKFRVLLNDREIGYHHFRLTEAGGERRVEIEANFDVRILFLNAYRYRHSNVEVWKQGCLTAITSQTDDNGTLSEVRGRSAGGRFLVQTREEQVELPDCVLSFAYWDPGLLQADYLLNSQTGELQAVTVNPRGDTLLRVDGTDTPARRYDLAVGDTVISLWYAAADYRWLALETPAPGGRKLRYEPVAIPTGAPMPAIARAEQGDGNRG